MKRIAVLLAVCLLLSGLTALAEAEPGAKTPPETEVWRGVVTALQGDGVTLKVLEYNPEQPALPGTEDEEEPADADGPEDGDEPDAAPEERPEPGSASLGRGPRDGDGRGRAPFGGKGKRPTEGAPGRPDFRAQVETIVITFTDETQFFTRADDDFAAAAATDIAVGDVLTVQVEAGVATVVVIEADEEAPPAEVGI